MRVSLDRLGLGDVERHLAEAKAGDLLARSVTFGTAGQGYGRVGAAHRNGASLPAGVRRKTDFLPFMQGTKLAFPPRQAVESS